MPKSYVQYVGILYTPTLEACEFYKNLFLELNEEREAFLQCLKYFTKYVFI